MVVIKKLVAKGFKSFAYKTELVFGNGFNCVIGPNGSGKSLSYDSKVLLANGEEIEIGKLVEEKLQSEKNLKTLKDGIYCNEKGTYIISINPITMKSEKKEVAKFIKRDGEEVYLIKTRTGKEIKATGCHPVMIFSNGMLKSVLINQLKENDYIVSPRIIKINPKNNFDKNKARLLGYIIGDGYVGKSRIDLTNQDTEILEDFKKLVNLIYKGSKFREYSYKGRTKTICINNKDIVKDIRELFYKNFNHPITSAIKKIPDLLLSTDNETISQLLGGIYDTDGYVRRDIGIIEFCSKNKELTNQVQRLLLRFGIISKIKIRTQHATNTEKKIKRQYYYLYIHGYENLKRFYENIELKCLYKSKNLFSLIKKNIQQNTNIDFLPREVNIYIKEIINKLGLKVKNLRKEYPALSAYVKNRCCPTRYKLNEILDLFTDRWFDLYQIYQTLDRNAVNLVANLTKINISGRETASVLNLSTNTININWKKGLFNPRTENVQKLYQFEKELLLEKLDYSLKMLTLLNRLASSDIFWDQIVKIEKLKEEKFVYDLEVEDNHNFIANGIFVHNSNIMDSLCFVLGKSSAKEMRAEKSANLIYHGNKKDGAAKEAEVTIVFDNSTKVFSTDKEEAAITRIVKRNGTSVYKINEDIRTRQQVIDFLNTARIDPDGHNIVLQGDIIGFTEMKPEERRKVIEEISGISIYDDKKHKCLNELEKVDSRLNETEIILTERAANLRELKKERDQAIRYKELQESLKDDKGTYLHLHIKDKETKLEEIEKKKKEAEENISKAVKEIENLKNQILNFKEETKKINNEIEVKGEKEQLVLRKEIEELKTNIVKANSRIEICRNEIEKIKIRKEQLNNNIKDLNDKIKQLKSEKQKHEIKLKEIDDNEKVINSKLIQIKEKHGINNDIGSTFEELDKDIEKSLSEISKTNEEKQNLLRKKDQLIFKLNSIDEKLNNLKGSSEEVNKLKDNKKKFRELIEQLNKLMNEQSAIIPQLNKSRIDYNQISEDLAKMKARQIGIQEVSLGDLAIRKILELKKTLKGIHGTVSELGNVDSKYSLALEVAAGARIKSIVVETDIIAQKCIEHLKEHKLGTATFLPLNKIKSRVLQQNINEILKKEGVHGLATDIVKFDNKYSDIFGYVLGPTVIIDNVDIGRRIGIGNARMVTLEGDLLEPSGAMVGGYRQKLGFGFMEKEVDENVVKLEDGMKNTRKLIDHLENKKTETEISISNLRDEKAHLESEILKVEKTLNIEGIDVNKILDEKKNISSEIKNFDSTILNYENKIKEVNKILEQLKVKREKAKEQLSNPEISKDLEKLEEDKLKLKEQYLTVQSSIKNIDVQVSTMLMPEIEKTDKIIKQHEKENEEFLKELKNIEEIYKNRIQELKIKENEEKKFYTNFKDLIEKRNKTGEKIQKIETTIVREEEKTKGHEQRLNNLSIDRAKFIAEIEGLNKEISQLGEIKIRRGINLEELKLRINENEKELIKIGNVNLRALEVYESIEKEYGTIVDKVSKLKIEKEDVLNMMNEIETSKNDIFMKTYNVISSKFSEIFSQLTTKGEAFMELENKEMPLQGGIEIQIKIASNKQLDMKSLSGGEKTLAALALIFSIQEHAPSPFYLLDEVDAALDKKNSEMLSKLIQKYSSKAQYIVISHNDHVMGEAEYLYGVSMQNGITKVVSLKV